MTKRSALRMTMLLTAEHATNHVPPGLAKKLRVPPGVLRSHRGWDPGTAELVRAIFDAAPRHRRHGRILEGERFFFRALLNPKMVAGFFRACA